MNDLYDELRPADEPLDPATASRVWARISGESVAEDPRSVASDQSDIYDEDPDLLVGPIRVERSRRRAARPVYRRIGAWAAAAAAVAGLGATAAVVGSRDTVVAPSNSLAPVPPTSDVEEPVTSAPMDSEVQDAEAVDPSAGPGEVAAGTNFAVADYLPDGWELDESTASPSGSIFGGESWALLDTDDRVTGVVSVRAPRPISAAEEAEYNSDGFGTTVRGVPASEYQQGSEGGNPVPRAGISWIEDSLLMILTASSDAQPLMRPAAEALMIDTDTRGLSLPDALGLTPVDELGFADPAAVTTVLAMSPASSTFGVSVYSRPNTLGDGLDRLVAPDFDWEPIRIDDRDALVTTTPGGGREVAWLDEGMYVLVQSDIVISDDELFDIARGVRFTDADEFREIGNTIADQENDEIMNWDVFDRTNTPEGPDITVRSRPGSPGANAICVETPEPECTTITSEGGGIDGFETYGSVGFQVDGKTIGVAWVSNDLVIDSIDWTLRPAELETVTVQPSDFLNSDDGYIDGTTAAVLVNDRTERGRFVVVDIPNGERPPTIRFLGDGADPDTASIEEAFELTPVIGNSFSN